MIGCTVASPHAGPLLRVPPIPCSTLRRARQWRRAVEPVHGAVRLGCDAV